MLYIHGVDNGNQCGGGGGSAQTMTINSQNNGGKSYVPNSISSIILAHNQASSFHHSQPGGEANGPMINNSGAGGGSANGGGGGGHWSNHGIVAHVDNGDLNANNLTTQKSHFIGGGSAGAVASGNDLSVFARDGFCGQTENVRSFSVNKLLQINNHRDHSEGNCSSFVPFFFFESKL